MTRKYLIQLDGLRFIAVSIVMAAHWSMGIKKLAFLPPCASLGVDLFFVLSGFLISSILISNKRKNGDWETLGRFYVRRFLRIFPLYYLVLFVCIWLDIPDANLYAPWLFTYTANIAGALHGGSMGYVSHLWSLSVEEQFYIFFPFLVLFIHRKWLPYILVGLVLVGILSRVLLYANNPEGIATVYLTPTCLDCFAIGGILAYMKINHSQVLFKTLRHAAIFFACIGISFFFYFLTTIDNPIPCIIFGRFLFAVFCFWLIGKAATTGFRGIVGRFLTNRIVVYLGKISYGIYVYHMFMPYIFQHLHLRYEIAYYPFVTVGISALSYHLFENPINNLKRFFEYKKRINPSKHKQVGIQKGPRVETQGRNQN